MEMFPNHFLLFLLLEVILSALLISQYRDYEKRKNVNTKYVRMVYIGAIVLTFLLYAIFCFLEFIQST